MRPAPTGITRWLFRAPIHLYRWRLGFLLGDRFLLLNHVGRTSGLPRQTVVEVVRQERECWVICSAWGEQAQWYRNVMAHPLITVGARNRTVPVRAERLPPQAAEQQMLDYARRHPRAARRLAAYMGFEADGSAATYREVGRALPFLRLCSR